MPKPKWGVRDYISERWNWSRKGFGGICGWVSFAIGLVLAAAVWKFPGWAHRAISEDMSTIILGVIPLAVGASVLLIRWLVSPYFVLKSQRTSLLAQIKERDDELEACRTIPRNPAHIAIDRLYQLKKRGEAMLNRLKINQKPIPAEKDVSEWADKLSDIASHFGTYGEKGSFHVHYSYLGLPSFVTQVNDFPSEHQEMAKSIKTKLHLALSLNAKLIQDDMLNSAKANLP